MATLPIGDDKALPSNVLCAFRSDGDTIDIVSAAGGEKIGDVLVRNADMQTIAVISAIQPDYPATATAGDIMQARVSGMFWMPKTAAEEYADGARVTWNAGTSKVLANATGAHEVVGGYAATTDTYACVRINVFPGAAT